MSCGTLCDAPLFGSSALTQIQTILDTQLQQPFLKWYVRREEVAREPQAYNDAITDAALRFEMSVRICTYQLVWSVANESNHLREADVATRLSSGALCFSQRMMYIYSGHLDFLELRRKIQLPHVLARVRSSTASTQRLIHM